MPNSSESGSDNIFDVVRRLQEHMATFRVFVAPELHELVIRYLTPPQIQEAVFDVVDSLRR
jgi:hypothetical protein